MTGRELAALYERDLRTLIEEIASYREEKNLWKTVGSVRNPGGNLALHLIGGLNYLIGTTLGSTGYIRNRNAEFSIKGVERKLIIAQLEDLIELIHKIISPMSQVTLNVAFPIFFDKEGATVHYVLTQLLLHLNYHLGQINYLRRSLEG